MPADIATIAAATATLDYDLLKDKRTRMGPTNRILKSVALKGSAAAGDAAADVYIDTSFIGRFFNNATGFPNNDDLISVGSLGWPAAAVLSAVVVDAPATNPLNLMYSWDEI